MKRGKKMIPTAKKEMPFPMKEEMLKNIKEENEMIDDHGPVILGGRDKKPLLPKPKEEED